MRRGGVRLVLAMVLVCGISCCLVSSAYGFGEGRVFELVSPLYKGGYGATDIEAVQGEGEAVIFYSPGVFAGAPVGLSAGLDPFSYIARRDSSGWSTAPIVPPTELMAWVPQGGRDATATLGLTLAQGRSGPSYEAADQGSGEEKFYVHPTETPDISANWEPLGTPLKTVSGESSTVTYRAASEDFCHVLVETKGPLLESGVGAAELQLYEITRGCGGESSVLRLVAVNGEGRMISPSCKVDFGIETYEAPYAENYNAISTDGSEVFFTDCIDNDFREHQLFVRLGGSRTLEVSRPLSPACGEVPCAGAGERAGADFDGASEDGSRVYFTTTAQLVPGDTDTSNNLYLATIGCPAGHEGCSASERLVRSMTRTSVAVDPSEPADVRGVVRVAPDGSRVYFVAGGDLSSESEVRALENEGRLGPQPGADNFYVYDAVSGKTAFIGDLCSGFELSGSVDDVRCPSEAGSDTSLWTKLEKEAQTAGVEGRYLVFASYGQLLASDSDTAEDVYRYDAESGTLERVSVGEDGGDTNGNDDRFGATIANGHANKGIVLQDELNNRAISEDGSRIVFSTAAPLSAAATNGLTDVYEWHKEPGWSEGKVSLVSGSEAETPVADAVISQSGRDVFFVTTEGLVPQDGDGAADVYDARVGGGFAPLPAAPQPCSGDACQGPLTNPAPLLVPGSVSQAPEQSVSQVSKVPVKTKTKSKKKSGSKKKKKKKTKRAKKTSLRHDGAAHGGDR